MIIYSNVECIEIVKTTIIKFGKSLLITRKYSSTDDFLSSINLLI